MTSAAENTTTTTAAVTITKPTADELRLPVWFFAFEGVLAGAFDLLNAFPNAWPALVALLAVNITLSLTVMRKRLKLATKLWRGKETRKIALGLLAIRLGSHFALQAAGHAVTSVAGHVAFALFLGGVTVYLLAYCQRTALRTLAASA